MEEHCEDEGGNEGDEGGEEECAPEEGELCVHDESTEGELRELVSYEHPVVIYD